MKIGETNIKNSNCEKPLGIKIDDKLTFNEHLNDIVDNASRNINVLSWVAPYTNENPIWMKTRSTFEWIHFFGHSLVIV